MNKNQFIEAKWAIERLTGIHPDYHNELIYRTALKWLDRHFGRVPYSIKKWESSQVFWDWWKFQWNLRSYEAMQIQGYDLDDHLIMTPAHKMLLLEELKEVHLKCFDIYPARPIVEQIRYDYTRTNTTA